MKIEKTTAGYSVQLRLGAKRRNNFTIHTHDPELAQRRADVMKECARKLVESGRLVEAYDSLRLLGEASTDEVFEGVVDAVTQLCAEPIRARHGERLITWGELANDWLSGKVAESYPDYVRRRTPKSMKGDKGRVEHLIKVIGDVPLAAFTKEDAKRAMASLPKTTRAQNTRKAYALVIQRVINLAVSPCALIPASPLGDSFTPLTGKQPDCAFLYPDEDAQLMACADVKFGQRLVFGCGNRLGLRSEALLALTWRHLDLKRGHVRQIGKGGKWVHFEMTHGVWETLKILREQRAAEPDEARIFVQHDASGWSKRLRLALKAAGIDRPQLFERGDGCLPIRFHDLRASFITIALANDRSEMWIRQRSGHTSSQMIARYTRPIVDTLEMKDWLPLHVALGLAPKKLTPGDDQLGQAPDNIRAGSPAHQDAHGLGEPPGECDTHAHSPSPPASEVNHVGDRLDAGLPQARPLARPSQRPELAPQATDEVPATLRPSEVQQLLEGSLVEDELRPSGHADPRFSDGAALPGVAAGVAAGDLDSEGSHSRSTVIPAGFDRATFRNRTGDPRITNSLSEPPTLYVAASEASSSARACTSPPEVPHGLPRCELLLDEGDLGALLRLATEARLYALVARLGTQLARLEAHQVATSHALDEGRKKGSA